MYRCNHCGRIFYDEDAEYEQVCWEDYYGIGTAFQNKNYGTVMVCPYCGDEDFDERDDDELR